MWRNRDFEAGGTGISVSEGSVYMAQAIAIREQASRTAPTAGERLFAVCRSFVQDLMHPYHPERHYMRGPGPKWHAKHGRPYRGRRSH